MKMNKKRILTYISVLGVLLISSVAFTACSPAGTNGATGVSGTAGTNENQNAAITGTAPTVASSNDTQNAEVKLISPKDAKDLLAKDKSVILVDVRTAAEYKEGHIANSILVPSETIGQEAATKLTDKSSTIIVYCRSGRRSALAAQELITLGYTNVFDLGGIIDWPYEVVK